MLSYNPARLLGIYPRKGAIAVGADADIVVFDPEKEW
ncbi:amidohydrolase family protein [Virgibacillus dakarensis]|nr:amidohydrolase family protein [Virgibacillus dakarensis]